jgi:predicted nuclease with TOPRIM domain
MSNEGHDNDTCPNYATATRWMSAHGYCVTENKRLLAENADLKDRLDKAENQVEDLEIENYRLKAEVERLKEDNRQLTKAFEIAEGIIKRMGKAAEDAAKEGKPSNG